MKGFWTNITVAGAFALYAMSVVTILIGFLILAGFAKLFKVCQRIMDRQEQLAPLSELHPRTLLFLDAHGLRTRDEIEAAVKCGYINPANRKCEGLDWWMYLEIIDWANVSDVEERPAYLMELPLALGGGHGQQGW